MEYDICRAKVVSAKDRTKILPIGMRGELAVAGYSLQKGYWNDQARTDEVMIRDEQGKRWIYVCLAQPPAYLARLIELLTC